MDDSHTCSNMRNNSCKSKKFGLVDYIIIGLSYSLYIFTLPISICLSIKVVNEYERVVVFRLGRVLNHPKGPGLIFILPFIDDWIKIDIRTKSVNLPKQDILTNDSVVITVNSICYYRVNDPVKSVTNIDDIENSILLLSTSTLRTILASKSLDIILSDMENLKNEMQVLFDEISEPWGIQIERFEIKSIKLPEEIQASMAVEALSSRKAKAQQIINEGEREASQALTNAANILNENPMALSLRLFI